MSGEQWESGRARAERERLRRIELFDEIADRVLAATGIVNPTEVKKEYETEIAYYEQQHAAAE